MQPILYLAPLHGITNRIFRTAYCAHFSGFDAAVAPFILSVNGSDAKKNHYKDLIPKDDTTIRLIPQILSNDAAGFVSTAAILADAGYDEINWNLGCPYSMVAKKKRGSGLLPYPEMIEKILDYLFSHLKIAISLKLRLGMKDPSEIMNLIPLFNQYPLKKIIIHPRIGIQMYKGETDLIGFARAAEICNHEIVYNGDISDLKRFEFLRLRFPKIKEWMIGRGAIQDPFLAGKIRGDPEVTDPMQKIKAFHDELYRSYREILFGPGHVLDKMKEVWQYLGHSFPKCHKEMEKISRCHSFEAYERVTSNIFSTK